MGTGMPELGSKISLISKADIRYEGRLFTVDPQECTIALASVRSFGTEDRETQYPVPAQNQVYDYILFRGSDIKDIRVINNAPSLPNDPAIMQLSVPPSLGPQQFQAQGFSHPVLGTMGPQMAPFASGYGGMGMMGTLPPGNLASSINRDFRGMQGTSGKPTSVLDLIGGGSRSTTPASLGSRKSPTADQGVQTGNAKKDDKKTVKPIQPPQHRNQQQRPHKDSRGEQQESQRQVNRPPNMQNRGGHVQNQGYRQQGWGTTQRGSMQQRPRGRPRGAMNYRSNVQNNHQQQQQAQGGAGKPKNTLKFENDYDFEQANTQFEELKNQLEKMKIKDVVNGDVEKKDDSGNETGAGEGEQEDDSHLIYYCKAVSFFDNISCEAVERSKGRSQRTDWRAERKLNSETFGVASTRRNNSYFRNRGGAGGGYYNRGFRGSYRGGYRNQGNGQQHYVNRSQQNPNQNKQQSGGKTENAKTGTPVSQPEQVPASTGNNN